MTCQMQAITCTKNNDVDVLAAQEKTESGLAYTDIKMGSVQHKFVICLVLWLCRSIRSFIFIFE